MGYYLPGRLLQLRLIPPDSLSALPSPRRERGVPRLSEPFALGRGPGADAPPGGGTGEGRRIAPEGEGDTPRCVWRCSPPAGLTVDRRRGESRGLIPGPGRGLPIPGPERRGVHKKVSGAFPGGTPRMVSSPPGIPGRRRCGLGNNAPGRRRREPGRASRYPRKAWRIRASSAGGGVGERPEVGWETRRLTRGETWEENRPGRAHNQANRRPTRGPGLGVDLSEPPLRTGRGCWKHPPPQDSPGRDRATAAVNVDEHQLGKSLDFPGNVIRSRASRKQSNSN